MWRVLSGGEIGEYWGEKTVIMHSFSTDREGGKCRVESVELRDFGF